MTKSSCDLNASKSVCLLGLTGSIGSGKSTVADLFAAWGSKVIDFDQIGRDLLLNNRQVIEEITSGFGNQVLRPDKSIDRYALRAIIFADQGRKKLLEQILHPRIREQAQLIKKQMIAEGAELITLVIPLLFESQQHYRDLNTTVMVACPRSECILRASKRDNCPQSLIASIYDSQMPQKLKVAKAGYVIDNSGSLEDLKVNARNIFDKICRK